MSSRRLEEVERYGLKMISYLKCKSDGQKAILVLKSLIPSFYVLLQSL